MNINYGLLGGLIGGLVGILLIAVFLSGNDLVVAALIGGVLANAGVWVGNAIGGGR